MKKPLLFILFFISSYNLFSQNILKDYKTVFYQEVTFETDDYKMYLVRCFSREDILKLKVRVFNKTKDVIYIKPEDFKFNIEGKTVQIKGRPLVAFPEDEDSQLIDITGNGDMRVEKFEITLNGLYKISLNSEIYETPNSDGKRVKEVVTGPFNCTKTAGQTNKEKSFWKFECVYSGDKIGILDPNKSSAIMSTGKENSNGFPKPQIHVLEKGQTAVMTVEFRKQATLGNLTDGYEIKWNNTFKSSPYTPLKVINIPMVADMTKSEK